ncbi:hypothetical protein BJ138DRAFT_1145500 [Hygrophoropsis aurantiaca]|uniref:Uncharacterized protein n=1 Tax=Hygrophoropsis aurantiaca TaxID=72124 RepID=A0ACB8AL75_9AGAM|nr:hypothetical protein BJ138DRAFT_1145500 [Hygrophoropsis aurantiaca]
MFSSQPILFALLAFFTFFSIVSASPIQVSQRDVWTPDVTAPTTGAIWIIGETYTVTWDTSSPPAQVTNPNGKIYLRQGNTTQSSPIVQVPLSAGQADVTVPEDATPGDDWRIVLFGDSGNWSNQFTIAPKST